MERVHFYGEYDGETGLPESGVANFNGQPHYFWLVSYRQEPYRAEFELAPVSKEAFALVLEQAGIWRRWELAYHGGEVSLETWPALASDREADEKLRRLISADQIEARQNAFVRIGAFQTSHAYTQRMAKLAGTRWPVPGWHSAELEVTWGEA
jgi:hypothetical protein